MSSPVISIDEGATVRDTITLMREKNIRRLIVSSQAKTHDDKKGERGDSSPISIVSLMSIVGNVPAENL